MRFYFNIFIDNIGIAIKYKAYFTLEKNGYKNKAKILGRRFGG